MGKYSKPELVIGLAGPVGTDLQGLAQTLDEMLLSFGYHSKQIRVSNLITEWCDPELKEKINSSYADRRIELLMAAGDALRADAEKGDALMPLILTEIRAHRKLILEERNFKDAEITAFNQCYIINSLKHPDEVRILRGLYGANFILISGFASLEERRRRLCELIAKSHLSTKNEDFEGEAKQLIQLDSERPGSDIGQSLRKTFPEADFFIRVSGEYENRLTRFLELFFGHPYITPYKDEFLMYEAKAKALRSADLSRQVGAVIVDRKGNILSGGCNEVPLGGGGAFWPDQEIQFDNRDFRSGRDFNAVKKVELLEELVAFLASEDIVSLPSNVTPMDVVRDLVFGRYKGSFRNLRVSNLIEFGRMVHAEMFSLMDAARRGVAVDGGTLYCTTFPCHMCARHIIAAGIETVVFIEPYPKSMTEELYPETVLVDREHEPGDEEAEPDDRPKKVRFEPFEGVAPAIYDTLFRFKKRRDSEGYTLPWNKAGSMPTLANHETTHLISELAIAKEVGNLAQVSIEAIERIEGRRENGHHPRPDTPTKSKRSGWLSRLVK